MQRICLSRFKVCSTHLPNFYFSCSCFISLFHHDGLKSFLLISTSYFKTMKIKKWMDKLGIFLQKLFCPLHCFYSSCLLDGSQWPFYKILSFFLSKCKSRDRLSFFSSLEHELSKHLITMQHGQASWC